MSIDPYAREPAPSHYLALHREIESEGSRPTPPEFVPGRIIAEFDCGADARDFCKAKGPGFTITPGVNMLFAVRPLVLVRGLAA